MFVFLNLNIRDCTIIMHAARCVNTHREREIVPS